MDTPENLVHIFNNLFLKSLIVMGMLSIFSIIVYYKLRDFQGTLFQKLEISGLILIFISVIYGFFYWLVEFIQIGHEVGAPGRVAVTWAILLSIFCMAFARFLRLLGMPYCLTGAIYFLIVVFGTQVLSW
jgi:glucose-6-phosphate-specific signal transduction histidine kinase